MPNTDPMVHSVPVLSALFVPYLLTTESKGLALLPLLCIASYRYRAFFFNHFYLAPFVGLVVGALQGALEPSALLPLAVPVLLHYCAVSASRLFAKRYKACIEDFANGISAFLDKKCYQTRSWPSFLYMKSERVLIALACIFKIALAVAYLLLFPVIVGIPSDVIGCKGEINPTASLWAWGMYLMIYLTETSFHCAMFLSSQIKVSVRDSFHLPVLAPTYWQWYFIATYAPSTGIWLPVTVECIRTISVSFWRMQDKEDTLVSPFMSVVDLLHGLVIVVMGFTSGVCSFPLAMLHRQLASGCIFMMGHIQMRVKKYRTWSVAKKPLCARMYVPYSHKDIECHTHSWLKGVELPKGGGEIAITHPKWGMCKAFYVPELVLERTESRADFDDPTLETFITYQRKSTMPGEWIRVDIPESAGILISEKEIETGLEGQFRVLHPLLDSKGVMRFFGSWGGKAMFAAKRYKMDPGGGWTMEERSEIAGLDGPARSAATNRHARLLAPYFQDCLMQEKAAEFGRAFNKIENLPVRKVEVLRACVLETEFDSDLPQLYLCEQYLDDSVPFRKFNNNDYVPGQQAIQNTPNMLSLFSYFHSNRTLVMCDIQGKKYKFTDPQFHSSDNFNDAMSFDSEDEGRDWLHSDGGLDMMKRVLVGFYKQKTLHALCSRVWPREMQDFVNQVEEWMQDEEFAKMIAKMEKSAKMYATYFNNLNPVMDASIGGPYVDVEDELDRALKGKGPDMDFDFDHGDAKAKSMDEDE